MSEWVSIHDSLPSLGQEVWIRVRKRPGVVLAATFDDPRFGGTFSCPPNLGYPVDMARFCGLTHWMARVDDCPPSFGEGSIKSAVAENRLSYYQRNKEKMQAYQREYYRKRRGMANAAIG